MSVERIVEALRPLGGDSIEDDALQAVIRSNFCEAELLDEVTSLRDKETFIQNAATAARRLSDYVSNERDGEALWSALSLNNGRRQERAAAVALAAMDAGLKESATVDSLLCAAAAAQMYLALASVPKAMVFGAFHVVLIEKSVELIQTICERIVKQEQAGHCSQSQQPRANEKKRGKKKQQPTASQPMDGVSVVGGVQQLSHDEREELSAAIHSVLISTWRLCSAAGVGNALSSEPAAVAHIVVVLRSLLQLDSDSMRAERCAAPAVDALQDLATRNHTETVFACLHAIVAGGADKDVRPCAAAIPTSLIHLSTASITFIKNSILTAGEDPETRQEAVYALVQHMCNMMPDKSEYRIKVAANACEMLMLLSAERRQRAVAWLEQSSASGKIGQRAAAIELYFAMLGKFVDEYLKEAELNPKGELSEICAVMLEAILRRCSDRSVAVRQRAMSMLSSLLSTPGGPWLRPLRRAWRSRRNLREAQAEDTRHDAHEESAEQLVDDAPLKLTELIMRRCGDGRPLVRKAAVSALQAFMLHCVPRDDFLLPSQDQSEVLRDMIELLCARCNDEALSARKQAAESLAALHSSMPDAAALDRPFLSSVLGLVLDNENSVVELGMRLIKELLLDRLIESDENGRGAAAWRLLRTVEASGELRRKLQRTLAQVARPAANGTVDSKWVERWRAAIEKRLQADADQSAPAFMLIADLSLCVKFDATPVRLLLPDLLVSSAHDSMQPCSSQQHSSMSADNRLSYAAIALASCATKMADGDAHRLRELVCDSLQRADVPVRHLKAVVHLACTLVRQCQGKDAMGAWAGTVVESFEKALAETVLGAVDVTMVPSSQAQSTSDASHADEELLLRRLFTVSELCQFSALLVTKRMFLIAEALLTSGQIGRYMQKHYGRAISATGMYSQQTGAGPSQATQGGAAAETTEQTAAPASQPVSESRPGTAFSVETLAAQRAVHFSGHVRALAVCAVGKLCLVDESAAKPCVNLLVHQLQTSADDTMRSNCLLVLADLCVRYTSLVDRHLSTIARSLRDRSALVRKQALTILTSLVKEDFLRWRGMLLYRFLAVLLDCDEEIRQFAELCLVQVLLARHPKMFRLNFVECVYHFNDTCHPNWATGEGSARVGGDADLTLKGPARAQSRRRLYAFMLSHMDDAEKFYVVAKLVDDVLLLFAEETLLLAESTEGVLDDALTILASKEIKLKAVRRSAPTDEDDAPESHDAQVKAAVNELRRQVITDAWRQSVVEKMVPTLNGVKHLLARFRSPLLGTLMECMRSICMDFKNDVQTVFAADKQLAAEIEYDLRRHEKKVQKERERLRELQQAEQRAADARQSSISPVADGTLVADNQEPMDTDRNGVAPSDNDQNMQPSSSAAGAVAVPVKCEPPSAKTRQTRSRSAARAASTSVSPPSSAEDNGDVNTDSVAEIENDAAAARRRSFPAAEQSAVPPLSEQDITPRRASKRPSSKRLLTPLARAGEKSSGANENEVIAASAEMPPPAADTKPAAGANASKRVRKSNLKVQQAPSAGDVSTLGELSSMPVRMASTPQGGRQADVTFRLDVTAIGRPVRSTRSRRQQ